MFIKIKNYISKFDIKKNYFKKLNSEGRILDLGCGKGFNAKFIHELFPEIEIYGCDLLPEDDVLNIILYQKVDIEKKNLPYPNEYFDAIIFTHVIEHLNSHVNVGMEINRILKKGGTIYLETPNWTTVFVPSFGLHREQSNPFNFYDDPTHQKPYSLHGLYEFLNQFCHLRVLGVGKVRNWYRVPKDMIKIITGLISQNRLQVISSFWNLFGWSIYGIGEKET